MVVRSRNGIHMNDEENGKRDDDHKYSGSWNVRSRPLWRKRRIGFFVLAAFGIWLFIHYIPTDLLNVDSRFPNIPPPPNRAVPHEERKKHFETAREAAADDHPARADPVLRNAGDAPSRNYDGPIKFFHLAATLRTASNGLYAGDSTNILFAASDLGSAAALIPLACEMGSVWKKNTVHLAIMGRNEMEFDELKAINGVRDASCNVAWHDARPDYPTISTEGRMEISVAGAMGHINQYLKPVALITTDTESENSFFSLGIQRKIKETTITHIEVPSKNPAKLGWLTRLDHASLNAWHSATFDILVRAPLESSGSLVRLLKSLSSAEYSGFAPPRLVIELPHIVDKVTQHFLHDFKWPPEQYRVPGQNEQLTIRRRITDQRENAEDASLRFIETFYPSSPAGPHVLILSPQVELSPVYFHYLKLHLLEYKHSMHAMGSSSNLFGISLEAPSTYLNGTRFDPPRLVPDPKLGIDVGNGETPYRWQAPNGNAALYFADKWMEAHSFLQKRHAAIRHESTHEYYEDMAELVSTNNPAWVEYFLEFMRARAWSLHYPSTPEPESLDVSEAIAVVHNELYQLPEEFSHIQTVKVEKSDSRPPPPLESVLVVKDDYLDSHSSANPQAGKVSNIESPLLRQLDNILVHAPAPKRKSSISREGLVRRDDYDISDDGFNYAFEAPAPGLPQISTLPLLDHDGELALQDELLARAEFVRVSFRRFCGGCSENRAYEKEDEQHPFSAVDLFCFDENDGKEEEDDEEEEEVEVDDRPAATVQEPSKERYIHGSDGAAAVIDRVVNAEKYKETALAGFEKKITNKIKENAYSPPDDKRIPPKAPRPVAKIEKRPSFSEKEDVIHGDDGVAAGINRVADAERHKETAQPEFLQKLNTLPEAKPNTNRRINPDAGPPTTGATSNNAKAPKADYDQLTFATMNPATMNPNNEDDLARDLEERNAAAKALEAVQNGRSSLEDHDDDEFIRLAAPKVIKDSRARKANAAHRPQADEAQRRRRPQPARGKMRVGTEDDNEM